MTNGRSWLHRSTAMVASGNRLKASSRSTAVELVQQRSLPLRQLVKPEGNTYIGTVPAAEQAIAVSNKPRVGFDQWFWATPEFDSRINQVRSMEVGRVDTVVEISGYCNAR